MSDDFWLQMNLYHVHGKQENNTDLLNNKLFKIFFKQKDVTPKPKLQSQLSSADLFGDDEELSSDEEQVRFILNYLDECMLKVLLPVTL